MVILIAFGVISLVSLNPCFSGIVVVIKFKLMAELFIEVLILVLVE